MKTGIIKRDGREYVQIIYHPSEQHGVSATLNCVGSCDMETDEVTVCIKTATPRKYLEKIRRVWEVMRGTECDFIADPAREPITDIEGLIGRRNADGLNTLAIDHYARRHASGDSKGTYWLAGALRMLVQDNYITPAEYNRLMKALERKTDESEHHSPGMP